MLVQSICRYICRSSQIIRTRRMSALPLANDNVLGSETGDKGVITINRPKALNAINLDMVRKIYCNLKDWESYKSLVIIKGAGDKSFCAGGDVRAIVLSGPTEESKSFFQEEYRLNNLIGSYKIPYIALLDGITMGGGVGLSVHGRYRVATERTVFAMPETAIGLFPDVGGSHFLPRLEGKLGLYLGLTGFRLKGEDVLKAGIATHFCESSKLDDLECALLNCKNSKEVPEILGSLCLQATKKEFSLSPNIEKINKYFDACTVEEIFTNLAKDGSEWAVNTLKGLCKMSPTSLKVTHQELVYGAQLSLSECLKMEYRMVVRHLEDSDFKEGVRALLIDKDQNPKWNPPSIQDVSPERVQFYFANLSQNEELQLDITYEVKQSKL